MSDAERRDVPRPEPRAGKPKPSPMPRPERRDELRPKHQDPRKPGG